jgi:hypothetical protein
MSRPWPLPNALSHVALMLRRVICTGWETLETLGNLLYSVARLKIQQVPIK